MERRRHLPPIRVDGEVYTRRRWSNELRQAEGSKKLKINGLRQKHAKVVIG